MALLHNASRTSQRLPLLLVPALLLLLLLLLGTTAVSATRRRSGGSRRGGDGGSPSALQQCQALPRFRVNGVEPLTVARGSVTLAALLTSTCPFCLTQAIKLQNMSDTFEGDGTPVHMMIINGGPRARHGEEGPFQSRVSFPIYHDDDSNTIWRQVFYGNKDDIFIIDRCGRLTYRIPFPYSYLGYNYVRRALRRTLTLNICECSLGSQDPHDVMMGDAPSLARGSGRGAGSRLGRNGHGRISMGGHHGARGSAGGPSYSHRNLNRSRCPRGDKLCRDLRKARRRYNRFRRRHGLQSQPDMPEEEVLGLFQSSQRGMSMGPAV